MLKNIAIFGNDGAGKSTLARAINYLRPEYKIAPLAEALRHEIVNEGLATLDEVYEKPTPPHIRALLIDHAKIRAANKPSYWLDKWADRNNFASRWTQTLLQQPPLIVDDARYLKEFFYFHGANFLTVYLDAPILREQVGKADYYEELPMIQPRVALTLKSKQGTALEMAQFISYFL